MGWYLYTHANMPFCICRLNSFLWDNWFLTFTSSCQPSKHKSQWLMFMNLTLNIFWVSSFSCRWALYLKKTNSGVIGSVKLRLSIIFESAALMLPLCTSFLFLLMTFRFWYINKYCTCVFMKNLIHSTWLNNQWTNRNKTWNELDSWKRAHLVV